MFSVLNLLKRDDVQLLVHILAIQVVQPELLHLDVVEVVAALQSSDVLLRLQSNVLHVLVLCGHILLVAREVPLEGFLLGVEPLELDLIALDPKVGLRVLQLQELIGVVELVAERVEGEVLAHLDRPLYLRVGFNQSPGNLHSAASQLVLQSLAASVAVRVPLL